MSEFKVGDKVVSIAQDTIRNIFEITAINPNYMESFDHELNYGFWRIAKPEEIAVGHRIDQTSVKPIVDIGDDFPIENHISPNCKVEDV
ncbi:hypothetical protein [Acinetobacter phage BUCT628]|nr:hypothetical protein [Acinetobacter phage BUCT628]